MGIEIVKNSITNMDTEAVVNAANSGLRAGGGVCGYIFEAAGYRELQEACNKIGHCNTGDAVITPGFKMKNKYIIHAVGPIWEGGNNGERALLYGAYYNSLLRAKENNISSIAFPLISAGIFGYPIDKAWKVAIEAVSDFLEKEDYDIEVKFAVLDEKIIRMGERILSDVDASQMTELQLHAKFQRGYDDYQAGRTQNAADAFAKFRESHS